MLAVSNTSPLRYFGVLGDSYQRALIDRPLEILEDMRQQGFRISDQLVAKFEVLLRTRYTR